MLRKRKVRNMIAAGTMLAAISGVAFAQAAPAHADPTEQLVVVGSDTIQDVWNAFATGFGGNNVGSYNAVNPATGAINEVITPTDGWAATNNIVPDPTDAHPLAAGDCSFARPNGSGQGVADLRLALNASSTNATAAPSPKPGLGCVDIARSSSGPSPIGTNPSVDIQYVPFAVDGVTGSTGPTSCTPATNCPAFTADLGNGSTLPVTTVASTLGAGVASFTKADLTALYNCNTATEAGITYWATGSPTAQPAGSTAIDLYQPQPGSGTRSFWEGTSGINFPDASPCVHDHIINGALAPTNDGGVSVPVEEHDGTAVSTDPIGFGPFSIAQYISQSVNNHNPRVHGAVLQPIGGVSPFNTAGTPSSGLNTTTPFPILRYVYDVVKLSRLSAAGDPIGPLLSGTSSSVCRARSTITSFGFALMTASVLNGFTCGQVATSLEAAP
jgi:ABC-type phosphate transport system substrate-binding protein